jgi:hypothetical protein
MTKRILLLILAFALIYGALYWIAFSPGGKAGTAQFIQGSSIGVFKALLPKVYFESQIEKERDRMVYKIFYCSKPEMERLKQEAKSQGRTDININLTTIEFYVDLFVIPYLFLLTLILITTLNWKQKAGAVFWGSLLMYIFYLFKMFLVALTFISENSIGVYDLGPIWEERFSGFTSILNFSFSFFAAMVIWVLVTVKDNNWRNILIR